MDGWVVSAIELLIQRWALRHRHPLPAPITDSADVFLLYCAGPLSPSRPTHEKSLDLRIAVCYVFGLTLPAQLSFLVTPHCPPWLVQYMRTRGAARAACCLLPACLPVYLVSIAFISIPLTLLRSLMTSTKLTGNGVHSEDTRQVMFRPLACSSDSNFEMTLERASGMCA